MTLLPLGRFGGGHKKRQHHIDAVFLLFGRDEATRTPDPYVPNVVRYQLRYIPICGCKGSKKK